MFRIISNLVLLNEAAKRYDDSEVVRLTEELLRMGAPVFIVNRALKYAFIDRQIEHVKRTLLSDLRAYKFSCN